MDRTGLSLNKIFEYFGHEKKKVKSYRKLSGISGLFQPNWV